MKNYELYKNKDWTCLGEKEAEALKLKLEGLSVGEIAKRTGTGYNNVYMRLQRATEKLDNLEKYKEKKKRKIEERTREKEKRLEEKKKYYEEHCKNTERKGELKEEVIKTYQETGSIKDTAIMEGISMGKVRKILSSEGIYISHLTKEINQMYEEGASIEKIAECFKIKTNTVNSHLKYIKGEYNKLNPTVNAERIRKWREKKTEG